MVSGVNRSPIVMSGLVSGLDTKTMIQNLLDAKRGPVTIMQAKVAVRQKESDALKDINGRLTNLLGSIKKFADFNYTQSKTASVTAGGGATSASVSASAAAGAATGSFKVTVNQLADATRVASPAAIGTAINPAALLKDANLGTAVTKGKFTVNGVQIDVDPAVDSLNDVKARIEANVTGVTVSLVNDSSGRLNRLQIAHAAGVTLGSGADDSNFLTSMKLLSSPAGTSRTSTGNLGVVQTGATLAAAGLTTGTGSFKINGVAIAYDSGVDSLNMVLSRINTSTAGVTASYDGVNDKVTLVSKTTGSVALKLEDVGAGTFLNAIGVRTATQTLGKNAQLQVDTGAGNVTYYSTTNTVSDAVQGVTLSLLKESATADTVTVAQDTSGIVGKVRDLISQFNSAVDFLKQQTAFDPKTKNGTLAGDTTIAGIDDNLRLFVTAKIDGVTGGKTSLADLGISFGSAGSKVGTTNLLQLDESKFTAALQSDPAGVAQVFAAFGATATLQGGGTGGVQGIAGDPTGLRKPGTYTIDTAVNGDGTANITATFKPADGSAAVTSTLTNVAAGSARTDLIPGVTVTFKGAFAAGTDTISIATPKRGIAAKLEQYLDPLTRSGGSLDQRQDIAKSDIDDMKKQIDKMNGRLDDERVRLQAKFAAMEQALARLQQQRSQLATLAQLG